MAIYNINDFEVKSNKTFIFDANIWLYLFSPLHEKAQKEIKAYSKFLESTISRNCTIYITSSIISEIANVILRSEYKFIQEREGKQISYKHEFIGSQKYVETMNSINTIISIILNIENVEKINDQFNGINIDSIINNTKIIDWNDSYLIELAQNLNSIIVTNDKDFFKPNINIDVISFLA